MWVNDDNIYQERKCNDKNKFERTENQVKINVSSVHMLADENIIVYGEGPLDDQPCLILG